MDRLTYYRQAIKDILLDLTRIPYAVGDIQFETIFDEEKDRYCLMIVGWHGAKRVHGCLVQLDIIDGKVWIQRDGTEDGIAYDLEAAGIPKDHIVLGFQPVDVRPHTEYAVA